MIVKYFRSPLFRSTRCLSGSGTGAKASGDVSAIPPSVSPTDSDDSSSKNHENDNYGTAFKMFESACTTFASLIVIGAAGYSYHRFYKYRVLKKIDNAFKPGDPALELAGKSSKPSASRSGGTDYWIIRNEQDKIDGIVDGTEKGHYYLLIGEKGNGKTSMLLEAMQKIEGDRCSMLEAHGDPEIMRIRVGKALDFEFNEDYVGSLFSFQGPRQASALLDIERAFNKLEKVALRRRRQGGRPLIVIVNAMHHIRNDEGGKDLLELLQQRAESWAASGIVTMVFNSDDYWVWERLKVNATNRMQVIPFKDLTKTDAVAALKRYRTRYFPNEKDDFSIFEQVYELVGGRLNFLNNVAKTKDMVQRCKEINKIEKTWFLNQCGLLGSDMDDDVMNQQKYASAAMVLASALVHEERETEAERDFRPEDHALPELPLHKAREIMTRADFIKEYDHMNLFTIDSRAMVRADSVPMMNAFREIVSEADFDQFLEDTLKRIKDIESLGRTREIVSKDLTLGAKYKIKYGRNKSTIEAVSLSSDMTP